MLRTPSAGHLVGSVPVSAQVAGLVVRVWALLRPALGLVVVDYLLPLPLC